MSIRNRISTLCLFILSILVVAGYNYRGSQPTVPVSCTLEVADTYSYFLIDSILQYGLDHEALYTLLANVKPISDLVDFDFFIDNTNSALSTSSNFLTTGELDNFDRFLTIQKAVNLIQIPDIKVVMNPFWRNPKILSVQLKVVRISSLDSLLKAKENFFGQFGFVPGSDPYLVVNTIEFSDRYERARGYGYLYGFPDYAVDFFVEDYKNAVSTGKFGERNFFRIPDYSNKNNNFAYVYPKNVKPTSVDSALYYRANSVLEQYRKIRPVYTNADGTVRAYELLIDLSR